MMVCYTYVNLQKKLLTSMLSSYHRWIFKSKNMNHLRQWVLQEAEFQTKALEAYKHKASKVRIQKI